MNIQDIHRAKMEYETNKQHTPTKLNISEADAIKLLNELIGAGALNRDRQDEAIDAINTSKQAVYDFLTASPLFGMKIKLVPVVS